MRTRAAAMAVCCALVLHAAPVGAEPVIDDVPDGIVRLLEAYGGAYVAHDVDALDSIVAPPMLEEERGALANASEVVFDVFDIEATTQFSGDLAGPRIESAYPGQEVATFHVVERSRIGGETGTFEEDGAFTFVRSATTGDTYDGWRLASKDDLDILGFYSPHHLWDTAEVAVVSGERFVLLTHPDAVEQMRGVVDVAERALDQVAAFWPEPIDERYVIIAPSTTEELDAILRETLDLANFVAFVIGGADRRDGWTPTGPRMFVQRSHLETYSEAGQVEILAHELVHAVTRPLSGPNVPTWIEEGIANHGGGTGRESRTAGTGPAPESFPTDDVFVTGSLSEIQAAYDGALTAIEVIVDRFGVDGLVELYAELGSARIVAGTETHHVQRAVEEALGWSYDEWVAAWRQRLG